MTDPRVTGPWDLGNKSYIVTGRDFIKFSRLGSIPNNALLVAFLHARMMNGPI